MSTDYAEEREVLDTKDMLESGFFARLGKTLKPLPTREAATRETPEAPPAIKYNTEKLMINLFEIRDGLIDTYAKLGVSAQTKDVADHINKLGSCINSLGGKVEKFDPFVHMSGLQTPSLLKNAKRVIENTMESYSIGKVEDAKIGSDGKTITMTFTGTQEDINYKATGTLKTAKAWVGNEAIDYIYTPGEGRMSVKTFSEDGRWIDKSANYQISWELYEAKADFNVMPTEGDNSQIKKAGKADNTAEIKEEVQTVSVNNIDDESVDFNIEVKDEDQNI